MCRYEGRKFYNTNSGVKRMAFFIKLIIAVIIGLLLISKFPTLALIIVGLVILYYLIRWVADIYWWNKKRKEW